MTGARQVLTPAEIDRWRTFYERTGAGPYHSPDYLTTLAGEFEHDDERPEAFVYESDKGFVYYPYLRRSLSTVPFAEKNNSDFGDYDDIVSSWYYGGPLQVGGSDDLSEQFAQAFQEYCREANIVAEFIRFDPNRENHATFDCLDPIHNRQTVPVDLSGTIDDTWEGYEGRNQRAIKQARETHLNVEPTRDPADYAAFYEIYSNAMEARDADEHYRFRPGFFESLLAREDLASLLVARYQGSVVGGFLVVHDERVAHHYLSASNPDYWDMRVNNLMYHEVVTHMHETGRDMFDFQGGRPGVFRFKRGFSPDRGEFYIGKRVHIQSVYDNLMAEAESVGIDTDGGYFPAYRVDQSN